LIHGHKSYLHSWRQRQVGDFHLSWNFKRLLSTGHQIQEQELFQNVCFELLNSSYYFFQDYN
jgi:hypothetical protein